jgi:hypothetical protein
MSSFCGRAARPAGADARRRPRQIKRTHTYVLFRTPFLAAKVRIV